jgi:hypothetical protein
MLCSRSILVFLLGGPWLLTAKLGAQSANHRHIRDDASMGLQDERLNQELARKDPRTNQHEFIPQTVVTISPIITPAFLLHLCKRYCIMHVAQQNNDPRMRLAH